MTREIDRKLRLTAALLGTITRKDLAAAFRRVNPATMFDVERADKWLQGRARPRGQQVYEDWVKVLELDLPGHWVAQCDSDEFLDTICARHDRDRESLLERAGLADQHIGQQRGDLALTGTYACYSYAWSPYFSGRLIRGCLTIAASARRVLAAYAETLPTGKLQLDGTVAAGKRALHLDVRESGGDAHIVFCLFPPTRPVSVLAGFMCGATIIGPDAQPSVTRVAIVRVPEAGSRLREAEAYLAPETSIATDLAELGLSVRDRALLDERLAAFLATRASGGLDQIPIACYRDLVALLDPLWLEGRTGDARPWQNPVEDPAAGVEA